MVDQETARPGMKPEKMGHLLGWGRVELSLQGSMQLDPGLSGYYYGRSPRQLERYDGDM